MSPDGQTMQHHPSPQRERVSLLATLFSLAIGPLAWYLQVCVGYALASTPCFHGGQRLNSAASGYEWTGPATLIVAAAALILSLVGLAVARKIYARTKRELEGGSGELMEIGAGRTRFLALWGIVFSAGAAVTILATAIAFVTLPRCAG